MRCLRPLYRICGRQALLPRSLAIPLCYDPTKPPQYCGGFTDVWKCEYRGRQVVAKVLRVYIRDDLRRIGRVGVLYLWCVNKLTVPYTDVLQGGYDLEDPLSSERIAAVGRDGDGE